MYYEHYFPLGIAKADAFIGREAELNWLKKNIEARVHTLIMAPRRFGKSSLVLKALSQDTIRHIEIDLQLCRSAKSVEKKLINNIEQFVATIVDKKENILKLAQSFFKKSNKQWKIGLIGFVELTLEPERFDDVANNILTILQFFESVLKAEKQKAVIFIDEIQEITALSESQEIQGAIRHFAQKTTHIAFVFSGSNRRLLRDMFEDNMMPLYQLCDTINLNKISEKDYKYYLNNVAQKTWQQTLNTNIITKILNITERHPRRTNQLCLYVWRLSDIANSIPQKEDISKAWDHLINTEAKGIRYYLSRLNNSQLKLLTYIALGNTKEITGKLAQKATDLTASALSKAAEQLSQQDLIEISEQGSYHVVDPVVMAILARFEQEIID